MAHFDVNSPSTGTAAGGVGIQASDATFTSGTVTLSGSNMVTVKTGAAQGAYVDFNSAIRQATISGNTSGALAAISSGTLNLAGGNNITLSQAGNNVTISGAVAGGAQTGISSISVSNTEYTSGRVVLTGSNAASVKSSAAGQTAIIDVPVQTAQTGISSISASNTEYTSGRVVFTGSNQASVKSSAAGQTVIIDVTTAASADTGKLNVLGNTAGTTNSISLSGPVALAGGNNITLSMHSDSTTRVSISGPNTSAQQTGISSISVTNTEYTSGRVVFTGSNMVTAKSSAAGQTVILDATQSVQTQSMGTGSVNVLSNTTGTTNSIPMSGAWALAGGPNITLSMHSDSTSRVTISGPSPSAGGGIATISASDTGFTGLGVRFTGSNMITVKSSGVNTVVLDATQSVQTQSAGAMPISHLTGGPIQRVALAQITSARMFPTQIPGDMTASRVVIPVSLTNAAASWTFGLYSLSNSSSATLWTSNTTSTPSGAGRSFLTMPFSCNITNGLQLVMCRQSAGSWMGDDNTFGSFSALNYTTGWQRGQWAAAAPASINITDSSLQRSIGGAMEMPAFTIQGY